MVFGDMLSFIYFPSNWQFVFQVQHAYTQELRNKLRYNNHKLLGSYQVAELCSINYDVTSCVPDEMVGPVERYYFLSTDIGYGKLARMQNSL